MKFDPSLGALTNVDLSVSATIVQDVKLESLDAAPANVTATGSGIITLTAPTLPVVAALPTNVLHYSFTAFDGTLDFGGTSGDTQFGVTASNTGLRSPYLPTSDFTGLGTITMPVTATASFSATGAGNLVTQATTAASAIVCVTYVYVPATPTSSPTATPTATPTSTDTPTSTPTASPTQTPTPTLTPTQTPTPTATPTNTATSTSTATQSLTETPTATLTPTDTPTDTATYTPTGTPTATSLASATPSATATGTVTATAPPTITPTPSVNPTATGTPTPTMPCLLSELNLGYCHSVHNDCVQEFCTSPAAGPVSSGLPGGRLDCVDDDPACDFGASGGDFACTFHLALCFNIAETRVPCVSSGAVEAVDLNHPSPLESHNQVDIQNRLALEGALAGIGAQQRGVCTKGQKGAYCSSALDCDSSPGAGDGSCHGRFAVFPVPLTDVNRCTTFADIKVPLKKTNHGYKMAAYPIRVSVRPAKDAVTGRRPVRDGDLLKLVCHPKP